MTRVVIALLLAGQTLLTYLAYEKNPDNPWSVNFMLSCGCIALAILLCFVLWRSRHTGTRVRQRDSIISWINQINVSADVLPQPPEKVKESNPHLFLAIQRLLSQLQNHREQLRTQQRRVKSQLHNIGGALYHTNRDGKITWVTEPVHGILGYRPEQLFDVPLSRLLINPEHDLPILLHKDGVAEHPTEALCKDGSTVSLLVSTRPIYNLRKQVIGTEGKFRDATRLVRIEHELERERKRTEITLAAIGDGVITTDDKGKIDYVNPPGRQLLGRSLESVRGRSLDSICHLFDLHDKTYVVQLVEDCLETGATRNYLHPLSLLNERTIQPEDAADCRSVMVIASPIRDEKGTIFGVVVVLHDVTQLERTSNELAHQATHDPLTGLLNLRAFKEKLEHMLENARFARTRHTLCCFDLDRFKLINDSSGHQAGDAVLRKIASHMSEQLRPEDTMARLGGDEFGIIFHDTDLETAETIAERLCKSLEGFFLEWEDKVFTLGGSFGLCPFDETSASANELMRRADSACYTAKRRGRSQVCVYSHDSNEARMRDFEIEHMQQITKALNENEFELYAQPIISTSKTGNKPQQALAELLLRIKGVPGFESTHDMMLTAERYGVATRIDRWVLTHALKLLAADQDKNGNTGCFSINISGQSIAGDDFVRFAHESIVSSGIEPSRLILEITETAIINNLQHTANLMRPLRAIGCRFAIDDFGSGATSINYLKQLPTDLVKIDGSLVANIADDAVDEFIIETICRMSQSTGHFTVAEHVETQQQQGILEKLGVDYLQGYYIAKPLPFEEYLDYVREKAAS